MGNVGVFFYTESKSYCLLRPFLINVNESNTNMSNIALSWALPHWAAPGPSWSGSIQGYQQWRQEVSLWTCHMRGGTCSDGKSEDITIITAMTFLKEKKTTKQMSPTWLNWSSIFWLWARYGVMNLEVSTLIFFLTCRVGKPAWVRTERNPINQLHMSGAIGALNQQPGATQRWRRGSFHNIQPNEKDLLFGGNMYIQYVWVFSLPLLTHLYWWWSNGKERIRYVPKFGTCIAALIAWIYSRWMHCMQGLNRGIVVQQVLRSRSGKKEPPLTVGHILTWPANQILINYRAAMHTWKGFEGLR